MTDLRIGSDMRNQRCWICGDKFIRVKTHITKKHGGEMMRHKCKENYSKDNAIIEQSTNKAWYFEWIDNEVSDFMMQIDYCPFCGARL